MTTTESTVADPVIAESTIAESTVVESIIAEPDAAESLEVPELLDAQAVDDEIEADESSSAVPKPNSSVFLASGGNCFIIDNRDGTVRRTPKHDSCNLFASYETIVMALNVSKHMARAISFQFNGESMSMTMPHYGREMQVYLCRLAGKEGVESALTKLYQCWIEIYHALIDLSVLGLTHNDIKSTNILIDDEGKLTIIDMDMVREDPPTPPELNIDCMQTLNTIAYCITRMMDRKKVIDAVGDKVFMPHDSKTSMQDRIKEVREAMQLIDQSPIAVKILEVWDASWKIKSGKIADYLAVISDVPYVPTKKLNRRLRQLVFANIYNRECMTTTESYWLINSEEIWKYRYSWKFPDNAKGDGDFNLVDKSQFNVNSFIDYCNLLITDSEKILSSI
jgi:serine/threonine protein kinase